jgi:integrase
VSRVGTQQAQGKVIAGERQAWRKAAEEGEDEVMIYKKGRYYMTKFMWRGRVIRKSTRCTSAKDARTVEGKIRSELGKGNWGVLESKPHVTLGEFLKRDFLPFVETQFQTKPNSRDYYAYGVRNLQKSELAGLRLDQITGQHVTGYIGQHSRLEATTINRDLRTLRRALSLAVEWGKLDRMAKVTLAKGEKRRDRVLTDAEAEKYLAACPQPWRDVATLLLGTGMRPGEAYALDWRNILLNGSGGLIQITQGKTKAARRLLPMVPAVYQALKARHEAQGFPTSGWVFPTGSASGHIEESSAKDWHAKALNGSKVAPFEPYCLRHTFGTRMAPMCDVFALARIMGHSSIAITQRYVHPQAEAIELAFQKLVTDGGHRELLPAKTDSHPVEVSKAESKG